MTKDRNRMLGIVATIIVAAVYNLILFIAISEHDKVFWISYIFTMFALLIPLAIQFTIFAKGAYPKKVFLGLSVVSAGFVYMIIQIVAGVALMFLPDENYKVALVVQIVILAVFLLIVIASLMVKNAAESFEQEVSEKRFYIQSLVADIQGLADRSGDAVLKKNLSALADAIKYSDPMSHESLAPRESKISALEAELESLIGGESADAALAKIKEMELALADRNRKAKLLK